MSFEPNQLSLVAKTNSRFLVSEGLKTVSATRRKVRGRKQLSGAGTRDVAGFSAGLNPEKRVKVRKGAEITQDMSMLRSAIWSSVSLALMLTVAVEFGQWVMDSGDSHSNAERGGGNRS